MKITSGQVKKVLNEKSSYYLIAMNSFPVFGVLLWDWDPVSIVFIYIAETIVIGVFNFIKILMSQTNFPDKNGIKIKIPIWGKLFIGGFFLVHFNGFNYGQIELFTSFTGRDSGSLDYFVNYFLKGDALTLGLVIIIISHLFSFYNDFLKGKQYEYVHPAIFMFIPYPRIFVQQFVGVFGAFFVLLFNLPLIFLIMLQVFKTFAELFSNTFINEKLASVLASKSDKKDKEKIFNQFFNKKNPSSLFSINKEG